MAGGYVKEHRVYINIFTITNKRDKMYEMSKKDKSKEMKEDKQTPSASAF
jgi:hypothetical protein